jgi:Uma2 family endonuclease
MAIAEEPPPGVLPTHLDLPCEDGMPVDNAYQPAQSQLLTGCLTPLLDRLHPVGDYFVGVDNGIYWKITEKPLEGVKVPDWFYVPNVPKLLDGQMRRSYVLWQERISPTVVVELVSGDGSDERDDTPEKGKFWVYERAIKARYYVIYDPDREDLSVFELLNGQYESVAPSPEGRFRITPIQVELGIWSGLYRGYPGSWLRVWDWNGNLIPCPEEQVDQERNRADQERNRADQERNRADQERNRADQERRRAAALAERLRQKGIDPDNV